MLFTWFKGKQVITRSFISWEVAAGKPVWVSGVHCWPWTAGGQHIQMEQSPSGQCRVPGPEPALRQKNEWARAPPTKKHTVYWKKTNDSAMYHKTVQCPRSWGMRWARVRRRRPGRLIACWAGSRRLLGSTWAQAVHSNTSQWTLEQKIRHSKATKTAL